MKISVVICTYARPEVTKELLLELQKQTYKDFEVIVVLQGNKDDLEIIKDLNKDIYSLRCYYEANHNLAHARNIGIKEAQGEIIVFLDDDTKPFEHLLEAHVANYNDPNVAIVGGRVIGDRQKRNVLNSHIGRVRKFDGFDYGGFYQDVRCKVMHVRGVNMSIRKALALEIGSFDERFAGSAEYEDMDFCLRALKKGYKIIFDPNAVVEHFRLSFGGCRMSTKEEAMYWLYRNHSLLFLNNFNKLFYPLLIIEYLIRIIRRSVCWHNQRVILSAVKGIRDGWKAHFN